MAWKFIILFILNFLHLHSTDIKNLSLLQNFINVSDGVLLFTMLESINWDQQISRDTMQYGEKYYMFLSKSFNESAQISKMPNWLQEIANHIELIASFKRPINHVILNRYHPGESISPHVDNIVDFGSIIAILSLGIDANMTFFLGDQQVSILIPNLSLLIMSGESRYLWKHSLKLKYTSISNRISISFRYIN